MPPRRDSTVSPSSPAPRAGGGPFRFLRLPSARTAGLAAVAVAGALGGLTLLRVVWPEPDRAEKLRQEITAATLAVKPRRPVTVLVIGSDADRIGAPANGAAPRGPANADALLLVRVHPRGPLQVLNLPVDLAVKLPGDAKPGRLGDLYRRGGVALTADAVRDLVGLTPPAPDRYLVLPRGSLRQVVEALGGLELNPPRTMRYQDKAMKYRIDLQSGLQRLNGGQVEQMVRYRDPWLGEAGRRGDHELVETALREQLTQPEQLAALPGLLHALEGNVQTNLTSAEALSLLAAGLDDARPIQFATLPLTPAKKEHGTLRQLDRQAPKPLWKEP